MAAEPTVLIAGATSPAGRAVAQQLLTRGFRVVSVGSDQGRLDDLARDLPGLHVQRCDLTDENAVVELVARVHATVGLVDGLIHLVGGWRGGDGIRGQTDADYRFLERSLTSLRHVSRAFYDDLAASPRGRLAIVSSALVSSVFVSPALVPPALVQSVEAPPVLPGTSRDLLESPIAPIPAGPPVSSANYVAVKAASEAWVRAIADGFSREAGSAAAVIFRVRSLADHEAALAEAITELWQYPAAAINGAVIPLS